MFRPFALLYGAACYALSLLTILYAIPFVTGVAVPRTVDSGRSAPLMTALLIDLALLGIFALQHSVMARPAFKRVFTRWVPDEIERSTYVLASSVALILLFWQWHTLPVQIWQMNDPLVRWVLYAVSACGWLLMFLSTFLINHFELFGLRQVWVHARGRRPLPDTPFVVRAFYRIVRHPLMLGLLIAFWATPNMSLGHLLFALANTGYILLAVRFLEERDLLAQFGSTYRTYQQEVPMLLPRLGRRKQRSPLRRPA